MKAKKIIYYLLGSTLVVIFFVGILEFSTRTISWVTNKGFWLSLHEFEAFDKTIESKFKWHPFTGVTFRPNISFKGSHPNQKTKSMILVDRYGFLSPGKNLKKEKSANEIRIATIGGSTTANVHLSYEENWPGYLGILVQDALPDNTITVINAGVPGYDTAQSIGNLALRVMPLKPDIVIIYHAYNDLKAIRANIKFNPDYSHIHNTPLGFHQKPDFIIRLLNNSMFYVRTRKKYREYVAKKNFFDNYNNMKLGKNRLANIPKEALLTFKQHIRSLISIAKAEGSKVILSSFVTLHNPHTDFTSPDQIKRLSGLKKVELDMIMHFVPGLQLSSIFDGINKYNDVLKSIAIKEKIGWVDNASFIPHKEKYFVDRVHFSSEGAKCVAENLLPVVLEKLKT
ncbi:MAG: SGNH/GDSL hydrolase family protein [Desulfobacterales bacterium]|nr:MAG: SGNH/GDSL hydrolase family protein [Desulfobacterales bacterium]